MSRSTVQEAFKHNRARKNVVMGGAVILVCITLMSCVSSFMIYREGFGDLPWFAQQTLSLFAVVVVEGAFIWLLYGFTRAFSSFLERLICLAGMAFLVFVMGTNIITHFMMVKGLSITPFQQAWLAWGAVSVFIAVLLFVLLITLADPVARLVRTELRYTGKQWEVILAAKADGLEGEEVQEAMIERAQWESRQLANKVIGEARQQAEWDAVRSARVDTPAPRANFDLGKPERKKGSGSGSGKGSAKKVPVRTYKKGSGSGLRFPTPQFVMWEQNTKGGWEAWFAPDGPSHRKTKTYLGHVGKRQLAAWQAENFEQLATAWLREKMAAKNLPVNA